MVTFKQVLTINNEGQNEFISTGATFNSKDYISLPTILGLYKTTDPTLRKYLKETGVFGIDYFLSDGRLYIKKDFLTKNHFYLKKDNISTYHPYRKTRILGSKVPYNLINHLAVNSVNIEDTKLKIIDELNNINWDYFITIHLKKYTSSDDWDVYMLNFIDEFSLLIESRNVVAAYSKELSLSGNITKMKYNKQHTHIHILLNRDSKSIKIQTIKSLFLTTLGLRYFKKNEFDIRVYDHNQNAIEYIMKDFEIDKSNFSMVSPIK